MYVLCICVCIYVYVYIYICVDICIYTCIYVSYMCIYMYTYHRYLCICTDVCKSVHTCIHVYICTPVYMYIYIYIYLHIYIYICREDVSCFLELSVLTQGVLTMPHLLGRLRGRPAMAICLAAVGLARAQVTWGPQPMYMSVSRLRLKL